MDRSFTLNRCQFEILRDAALRRSLAVGRSFASDSIGETFEGLKNLGLIDPDGRVTPLGMEALAPFKVKNAVILADGIGTEVAPLSFERPKALFVVNGEVLIERLIGQLREVGIQDIIVVAGYMKKNLRYLEEKLDVRIIVNDGYSNRDSRSSLWSARDALGNSYVVPSDLYLLQNVFSPYNYEPCLPACAKGPAYLNRELSQRFLEAVGAEYEMANTTGKPWEQVVAESVNALGMLSSSFDSEAICTFDSIADLVAFDDAFIASADSQILDNICRTLNCSRGEIANIAPLKAGLTNLSVTFDAQGARYIYRHPGYGTEKIINRKIETLALGIARDLGLDDTYLFEDPEEGWKISRFIEGCSELDYSNREQVAKAFRMARSLHTSGRTLPYSFDFFDGGTDIANMLREMGYLLPEGFDSLADRVAAISQKMRSEAVEPTLCHNDFFAPNFLVRGEDMRLIDWEYAAMGDPACDIGNFVSQGSGYTVEETLEILPLYYGRPATDAEQRHCVAAVGVVGWYWYVWAMYKEAMGDPVGEWIDIWHKAAEEYISAAEKLY